MSELPVRRSRYRALHRGDGIAVVLSRTSGRGCTGPHVERVEVLWMPATVYSYSRVSTFEQCARRFRYRYLDRVKEAFDSVEAFVGRQVHETIEWLFGEKICGRMPTAEQAVARYCQQWDRAVTTSARSVRVIKAGEDHETHRRSGAEIVARFHREQFVHDDLETLASEKHFSMSVGGRHRFQGFIDRLARDSSGRLHVIDYKTSKRSPKRFEGKEAEQLEAYALGVFCETEERELELVLEFVRVGRSFRRRILRSEVPELEARLAARIDMLEEATVFPPSPGSLCDWCGYNDLCEAYGTQAGVQRYGT